MNGVRKTTEQFIKEIQYVHGNIYDYSLVNYINNHTKVCIICSDHGIFKQRPNHHLGGSGCPKCARKINKISITDTTSSFIKKAKNIHGERYDYNKTNYINNHIKICIICPDHGEFWQDPANHLTGHGCPKCANKLKGAYQKDTTQSFIEKAKNIHGDKYDYIKVNHTGSKISVCIICPIHGEFWQTPNCHLNNHGCPACRESKGEKLIAGWLVDHKFKYDIEKTFNKCKNKRKLPFDFYIPSHNTCIEYDGEQHFISVDHWGGIDGLKKRQTHDDIKTKYCKNNNIHLIRIRYDESVDDVLTRHFTQFLT